MAIPRFYADAPLPEHMRGAIIALGNFDGFHQGHQAVAGEAIRWAREEGRPAIIATFDPHPVRLFKPDTPPFRLTTLDQRQRLFGAAGADAAKPSSPARMRRWAEATACPCRAIAIR